MIAVGQIVGNYAITAKLGEGGMGTVFLAEHPLIGSKVALKAIHPQFVGNQELLMRFMNEAKSVNQIGHDHIVDITDFGDTPEGDFYFIMEHLDGRSLAHAIAIDGPFAPARALNIAGQIADALGAAHEHGIVHRDLKPDNVILILRDETSDFVKVLDFGLAKLTGPDHAPVHQTGAGMVMGTPFYMAPEQCEGKQDIDHRTDIYALGVLLFEMLTGMVPFGGKGYGDILIKQITVPPPAASSLRPELSPALDVILYRAMAKDPAARFQTMADFRSALLNPEGYAPSRPIPGAFDDLTLRVKIAMPMPRAAVQLQLTPVPTTFRNAAGQLEDDDDELKPKTHHLRNTVLVGLVALGCVAFAGRQYRQQAKRYIVAAVSPRPATVLVTFNSDPDGASVAKADGTVLGVTPLLAEVPYGDLATEYVIRKEGYLAEVASIVPNVPSPFFAVLQPRAAPAPVAVPAPAPVAPPVVEDDPAIGPPLPEALAPTQVARRVGLKEAQKYRRSRSHAATREPLGEDLDSSMDPSPPSPPAEPPAP